MEIRSGQGIGVPFADHGEVLSEAILIAPPSFIPQGAGSVRMFNSLTEFDAWRRAAFPAAFTLASLLAGALAALDADVRRFVPELRPTFARLAQRTSVPNLKWLVLNSAMPSRTFYRRWKLDVPAAPHRFLLRVRVMHVDYLVDRGSDTKNAIVVAGFRSAAEYRSSRASFDHTRV